MQNTDNSKKKKAWVLKPHPATLNLRYSETRHRDNSIRIKYTHSVTVLDSKVSGMPPFRSNFVLQGWLEGFI